MMISQTFFIVLAFLPLIYSQACTEKKDFNTVNPEPQPTATSLYACKAQCFSHSTKCANGFDWIYIYDAITIRCFISTSTSIKSASGYTHYTCSSVGGVVTTSASNPLNIVTTQTIDGASTSKPGFVWVKTANTNSPSGVLKTSLITLDNCQNECIAAKDTTCKYGIDFNPSRPAGSRCFFAMSDKLNVNGYPGVDHYMYHAIGGSSECTWTEEKGKSSPGGELIQSATDITKCQDACKESNKCTYGFDFNPSVPAGSQCYIAKSDVKSDYPGVSHYTLKCQKPCLWSKTSNKNTRQGLIMISYNTLKSCQQACFNSPKYNSCKFGIDYKESAVDGFKCWFSTITGQSDYPGVDHYSPKCEGDSTTCSWINKGDKNSPSGILQSAPNSLVDCQSRCKTLKETTCKYGLDYVESAPVGRKCWFSISATLNDANGVKHFDYECSNNVGFTPGPNGCKWDKTSGKNSPGGIVQSAVTNLDQCKAYCLDKKESDCKYGFDWNESAQSGFKCWFGVSDSLGEYAAVDHYKLKCEDTSLCKWTPVQNKNTRNGLVKAYNDLNKCRDECLAAKDDDCKNGFDWQENGQPNYKCWFSTTEVLTEYPGVIHYSFSCGGLTTASGFGTTLFPVTGVLDYIFSKTINKNSPGGEVQATSNSLEACKRLCIQEIVTKCKYGFDYNEKAQDGLRCWFGNIKNTYDAEGINHYDPVKQERCIWNKQANSNTASGVLQSTVTTLQGCKDRCVVQKSSHCSKGFDWNTQNNKCYFAVSSDVNSGVNGVDHYTCSTSGQTTMSMTTSPAKKIATTLPTILKCRWTEEADKNTPGGLVKNYNSLKECQEKCILEKPPVNTSDVPCKYGIDFNLSNPEGSRCYFALVTSLATANGVIHYTCNKP